MCRPTRATPIRAQRALRASTDQGVAGARAGAAEHGPEGAAPTHPAWLQGRLVAVYDRAAATWNDYDGRGRVPHVYRQIAVPTADGATAWAARFASRWYERSFEHDGADREICSTTGLEESAGLDDVSETLGLELDDEEHGCVGSKSAVTTEYTARGAVNTVSGSYATLVDHVTRTADGLVTELQYGDLAGTRTTTTFDDRRRVHSVQTYRSAPSAWGDSSITPSPGSEPTRQLLLQDDDFTYDSVGNPTEIRDWRIASEWPSGAKPVTKQVTYDDAYRVTRVDYTYWDNGDGTADDTWTDPFDAEATVTTPDLRRGAPSPRLGFTKRPLAQTYQYDWLGNVTASDDDAHGFYDRSLGTAAHDADSPYRLTSSTNDGAGGGRTGRLETTYDDAGNLTRLNLYREGTHCVGASCSQRFDYQWDEVGRLVRARRYDVSLSSDAGDPTDALPDEGLGTDEPEADLSYVYDASDQRVLKHALDPGTDELRSTAYVFDSLELRRADFDADYAYSSETATPYLIANGVRLARVAWEPIAEVPLSTGDPYDGGVTGKLHVLLELGDHLGSTSTVLDQQTGELVERGTYQPYGAAESDYRPERWGGFREDYRFTGKEEDVEVGLTYFGKRYLSAGLGRWVSADPLTVHGLGADLNVYAYVGRRTLMNVDPLGLDYVVRVQGNQILVEVRIRVQGFSDEEYATFKAALAAGPLVKKQSIEIGGTRFDVRFNFYLTRRPEDPRNRDHYRFNSIAKGDPGAGADGVCHSQTGNTCVFGKAILTPGHLSTAQMNHEVGHLLGLPDRRAQPRTRVPPKGEPEKVAAEYQANINRTSRARIGKVPEGASNDMMINYGWEGGRLTERSLASSDLRTLLRPALEGLKSAAESGGARNLEVEVRTAGKAAEAGRREL